MAIFVDTILYLSLYYLVNDLVHLSNPHIRVLDDIIVSLLVCGAQNASTRGLH